MLTQSLQSYIEVVLQALSASLRQNGECHWIRCRYSGIQLFAMLFLSINAANKVVLAGMAASG
jgi:hypothetical protein